MTNDLNNVQLIGRLTGKPDLKYLPEGSPVAKFSIAVNSVYYDKNKNKCEYVSFIEITVWGKQGENCNKCIDKGSQVAIIGELRQDRWETDNGKRSKLKVIARSVQFLSSPQKKQSQSNDPEYYHYPAENDNNIPITESEPNLFDENSREVV